MYIYSSLYTLTCKQTCAKLVQQAAVHDIQFWETQTPACAAILTQQEHLVPRASYATR